MFDGKRILFVNNVNKKCGVFQYGLNIFNCLKKIPGLNIDFLKCEDKESLVQILKNSNYWAIIYNYHDLTLSFIDPIFVKKYPELMHICLAHELTRELVRELGDDFFDYYIFGDPTFPIESPRVFKIGRLIPEYENKKPLPEVTTIGSYGFVGRLKGFEHLIDLVQQEFDHATIRINMTKHGVNDTEGIEAKECTQRCLKRIYKPGIRLEVTHEFFTPDKLLDFLAGNTINVFPYAECGLTAISSAIDQAIAVKRPLAISNCFFFRHLFSMRPALIIKSNPYIDFYKRTKGFIRILKYKIVDKRLKRTGYNLFHRDFPSMRHYIEIFFTSKRNLKVNSLKAIIRNGNEPLDEVRSQWNETNLMRDFKQILDKIWSHPN